MLNAHTKAVTGLALSSQCPGCLITSSQDKSFKIWDIQSGKPSFICEVSYFYEMFGKEMILMIVLA